MTHKNARARDPQSSHEAAEPTEAKRRHKALVYECLQTHGPLAPEQIAERTGLSDDKVWRRCSDLKRDGLVRVAWPKTHQNRSGRWADVLCVVFA